MKRRDKSNNWTKPWRRLAALTDYDRGGGVLRWSEKKPGLCRLPPGKELPRRNVCALGEMEGR
jgi:hypothetical protein